MPNKRPAQRNTRLAGHALIGSGVERWRRNGCAQCTCGALSAAGISQAAARRWIDGHKQEIRDLRAREVAADG